MKNSPSSNNEFLTDNMGWSKEKYLNFIEDYKKSRVLWDIKNPNYKNNSKKRRILIILAQKYGTNEIGLRKKIKNLRSAFHREHHRLTNVLMKDQEQGDMRKWFAYDALKFILDVSGPYTAKREEQSYSVEESFQGEEPEDGQESFDISTQYIQLPPLIHEPTEETKLKVTENPITVSKEEDEFDLFGRSMTMQLRKLPELVALDLMQKMQLMVFNAKKHLNKAKNKTQKSKQSNSLEPTRKKKKRSPSPVAHSSPNSPTYKFEALSPEAHTRLSDKDEEFYEYAANEENGEIINETYNEETNEHAEENVLKRSKKSLNTIDPLEMKRFKTG